jgi:hypothetical protein
MEPPNQADAPQGEIQDAEEDFRQSVDKPVRRRPAAGKFWLYGNLVFHAI